MNFFEKGAFLCACIFGFATGWWLSIQIGFWGWCIGIVLGFGLVFTGLSGIRRTLDFYYKFRPLRPVCRNGNCHAEDYRYQETTSRGVVFVCACGSKYLLAKRQFFELLPDGLARNYMRRDWFGRWRSECSM